MMFAGLPHLDETAEMQERLLCHDGVAGWIAFAGAANLSVDRDWLAAGWIFRFVRDASPGLKRARLGIHLGHRAVMGAEP
jgi:hypothetical protein